jgi:hypothetical protein
MTRAAMDHAGGEKNARERVETLRSGPERAGQTRNEAQQKVDDQARGDPRFRNA